MEKCLKNIKKKSGIAINATFIKKIQTNKNNIRPNKQKNIPPNFMFRLNKGMRLS